MKCYSLTHVMIRQKAFWALVLAVLSALSVVSRTGAAPVVYFQTTPPDVPTEVLLGEQFKFKVRFKQPNAGSTFGYGPFIDLVLDMGGANVPKGIPPCVCDGITFFKAEMVGVNGGPIALTPSPATPINTTPCATSPSNTSVSHPFGGILPLTLPPGAQLITLELPFGSFAPPLGSIPAQPEIVVEVTVSVSNRADVGVPLRISARGGFRYGTTTALDDPSTDPPVLSDENPPGTQVADSTLWNAQAQVTPTVMILKKEYLGPEDETATGPNFPRKYKITANVATLPATNPLTNVVIKDCLPNNVVFTGIDLAQTVPLPVPIPPPQTTALNNNCISFNYPTIVGTSSPTDIVIVFNFYVPEKDANGNPILDPASCADALSSDDVKAEWDWVPLDPCDWQGSSTPKSQHGTSDVAPVDHVLKDKHLAIQKTVKTFPFLGSPVIPGVGLQYTLKFQISDFFTFGGITVSDTLADGQTLLTNPPPKLTVRDRRGGPTVVPLSSGLSLLDFPNLFANCGGVNGGRSLIFQVSTAMLNNAGLFTDPVLKQGVLTGGYAFTPFSSIPATGEIVFYAQVQDTFAFPHQGDKYVDKDDPINNCVTISADMYTNDAISPKVLTPPVRCADSSETSLTIVTDTIKKTVYAVKRGGTVICGPSGPACSNSTSSPQQVRPGDQVTFRVQKRIPSSDAEHLTIQDWLPLPKFDVSDPDANGAGGATWPSGAIGTCPIAQLPGQACKLPGHTLPVTPTFMTYAGTNSINFDYGSFNATNNQPKNIDLLFTANVTSYPSADGLSLTNEAQECEKNTFDVTFCQTAIAQVKVREPRLRIRKGVIATDNTHGQFSQPGVITATYAAALAPVGAAFNLNGFTGFIHSPLGPLIDSNLTNVDANDTVTFAIVVENQGGHPAYDVRLKDTIPSCLTNVKAITVKDGTGAMLPTGSFTITPPTPNFTFSLNGTASIPASATNGTNIIVITFQAQIIPGVPLGCCDNVAELTHYASQPNGPDFVSAGFTPPFKDNATVCVNPTLTKSLVATSEAHTTGSNLTIGEIARYRLLVLLPEGGVLQNFLVTDTLPQWLKFLNDNSARIAFVSNGLGITRTPILASSLFNATTIPSSPNLHAMPMIPSGVIQPAPNCGDPVIFDLGSVQNNDNDPDLEYIVIEFNALVCNVPGNHNSWALPNTFNVSVAGNPIATSNTVNATVVEPKLTIAKAASPTTVAQGGTITYTVTISNGPIQAFDVQFTDTLPAGLSFSTGSTTVTGGCSSTSSSSPAVTCSSVPVNGTVTITYKAVANPATCPTTLTNQAQVTWTSLPGLQGTSVNPTWSTTPGASGAGDGERNGTTPALTLNNYAASASAPVTVQCDCLLVSNESVTCNSNGTFSYSFTATNFSGGTVANISFVPPGNITITPSSVNIPPLPNGGSTNVTVTIGGAGAVSGANVCFDVRLAGPAIHGCTVHHCVTLPNCQVPCASPPPHMVSWWPLNETSGSTVVDVASTHNNGTTSATIGSDPTVDSQPKVGSALFFNSSNASAPGAPYNFGTGNFSIDAWVRGGVHTFPALGIVDKLDSTTGTPAGFAFFVGPGNNSVQLTMGNGTSSPATFMSTPTFVYNQWQHVAVTVRRTGGGPVGTFYINGMQKGTFVPPATSVNNTIPLLIGSYRLNANSGVCQSCEVALDEIEIFDDVVSPGDIKAIFDAGRIGKCP
jgi:uncharacterized repeat protein (TIGR01451 family)